MKKRKSIKFASLKEAEKYNLEYYKNLTCDERIEIGLKLLSVYYGDNPRLERVLRFVNLGECPVSSDRWMDLK